MQIKLANCNVYLLQLRIDMQAINSGTILGQHIDAKIACDSWEYDFNADTILITVAEGIEVPDFSELGELVENDGI